MLKQTLGISALSLLLMLQGCSFFNPVKTTEINTYTLSNTLSTSKKASRSNATLLVSTPTANPGLDSEHMLYTKKPHQIESFAYNQWVAPPAQMLTPLLVQNIKNTACFDAVMSPPTSSSTDYNLQTRITAFEQHFEQNQSHVRVGLNVTLTNNDTGKMTQQRFEVSVPSTQNTPYAGVIAINKATDALLRQVSRFVCMASR